MFILFRMLNFHSSTHILWESDTTPFACCLPDYHRFFWSYTCLYYHSNPSTPILSFLGILAAVGNFTVHPQPSSILLTWDPPFSLNITGVDPDLWYCVEVYNISRGRALLTSNCSVYEPQFYFNTTNPSPCHKFEFTAFAVNGVGNGSVVSVNGTFFKSKYQHNISFSHFTWGLSLCTKLYWHRIVMLQLSLDVGHFCHVSAFITDTLSVDLICSTHI